MKTLAFLVGVSAAIAAFTYNMVRLTLENPSAVNVILCVLAFMASLWIALFGYYGYGTSQGFERWIVLIAGFLPLLAMITGAALKHYSK